MNRINDIESQVIKDFGKQWSVYTDNSGYYASLDILREHLGPLGSVDDFKGKCVADIGSGTGRIVCMLAEAGAEKIVAVEPSAAMDALKKNTAQLKNQIIYFQEPGDSWSYPDLDFAVSIGVLHHIFDPMPTVRNVLSNLKSGGKFIFWVYGYEGNKLYLCCFLPIRKITPLLPHGLLSILSWIFVAPLSVYTTLCGFLPLPMRTYMVNHISKLDYKTRQLTIYDQLNPSWSKYYRQDEAEALLRDAGFIDVHSHHRSGYSWTVVGTKP